MSLDGAVGNTHLGNTERCDAIILLVTGLSAVTFQMELGVSDGQ